MESLNFKKILTRAEAFLKALYSYSAPENLKNYLPWVKYCKFLRHSLVLLIIHKDECRFMLMLHTNEKYIIFLIEKMKRVSAKHGKNKFRYEILEMIKNSFRCT